MSLKGKVAIVTGASSGIGAATAIRLSELDAFVILTGRNEHNLKEAVGKCKNPENHLTVIGDVTKEEDAKKLFQATIDKFGKLDILVNNAGILENGGIENSTLEQYDKVFDTNVKSVYRLTQIAVPHLIKTKGNIVNVSSVAGTRSFPNILAYCMSKAALDQFTKCVALELAPYGIRVNSVNPGVIVTDIHKRSGMDDAAYEQLLKHSQETHALGRVGEPVEVAAAIAFFATNESSFTTGELLHIDGGRHAMCPR